MEKSVDYYRAPSTSVSTKTSRGFQLLILSQLPVSIVVVQNVKRKQWPIILFAQRPIGARANGYRIVV